MSKILIIDDSNEFNMLMSCYFTDLGYTVELAGNGREGLEKAAAFRPDLILLDVMMPDIGGIEVLRTLQASAELSSIPVLVLTGTYFDDSMSELFRHEPNCSEFLSKTTELSYLRKKVESYLKKT